MDYQRQHFLGGYGIAYDRANDYIAYDFTDDCTYDCAEYLSNNRTILYTNRVGTHLIDANVGSDICPNYSAFVFAKHYDS